MRYELPPIGQKQRRPMGHNFVSHRLAKPAENRGEESFLLKISNFTDVRTHPP